jgi:hypothetical protein
LLSTWLTTSCDIEEYALNVSKKVQLTYIISAIAQENSNSRAKGEQGLLTLVLIMHTASIYNRRSSVSISPANTFAEAR